MKYSNLLCSKPVTLNISKKVDDGLWHTVAFVQKRNSISLYMDGCINDVGNDCQDSVQLSRTINLSPKNFTVGGIQNVAVLQLGKVSF